MNQDISLETVAGGVAEERFQRELRRILDNIADPNTQADVKRSVTLEITFLPKEDRENITCTLVAKSKLAPEKAHAAPAFLGRRDGEPVMVAFDPRQLSLDDINEDGNVETDDESVTPFTNGGSK